LEFVATGFSALRVHAFCYSRLYPTHNREMSLNAQCSRRGDELVLTKKSCGTTRPVGRSSERVKFIQRRRRDPALRRVCALTLVLVLTGLLPTRAQTSKEYQIKAAFLFNFAQFVEWPPAAFADANAPISIGVLGDDPFGPILDQTVQGETINHRKLIIQRSQRAADLKNCHLVFISKSERSRLADIFNSLESASVLTVSETENFARRGGIINFYLDGNKVRFEINADAAQRKGIKISSQLLKLGKVLGAERAKENG